MLIREIEKRDIWACTQIVQENWGSIVADRFWDEVQHVWLAGMKWPPQYLVAEVDGKVVGFAGMMESWIMHGVWDLIWINVKKTHQGQGIGKALTERRIAAIDRQKGAVVNLSTQSPRFFDIFGFNETHSVDGWSFMTKKLRTLKI